MISPQEPAGNEYYYPTRGTTRVSVTHPASAYAYWRKRIGEEIAAELEKMDAEWPEADGAWHVAIRTAAAIAKGE